MKHFRTMNTDCYTYGLPDAAHEQAEQWFRAVEDELSRFKQDSGLTKLNRMAGAPVVVSPLLFEVLLKADKFYIETGGLFNPYLGNVLAAAGYQDSFELIGTGGAESHAQSASHPLPDSSTVLSLDTARSSVTLSPGYAVDLGGIAKGWSAEQFAGKLIREGIHQGALDAGGDIMLWGETARLIDIADPFMPDRNIAAIRLNSGAGIATSSRMKRRWTAADGSERHHILDPHTLRPSASDLVQVTAICPTLTQAEVYAKCILILGSEQGLPWLERNHPDCSAVAVRADGVVMKTGQAECCILERQGGGAHASLVK
ncbi:FAD:protein FMN transferase [Paenibacillus sp. BAC0078]